MIAVRQHSSTSKSEKKTWFSDTKRFLTENKNQENRWAPRGHRVPANSSICANDTMVSRHSCAAQRDATRLTPTEQVLQ